MSARPQSCRIARSCSGHQQPRLVRTADVACLRCSPKWNVELAHALQQEACHMRAVLHKARKKQINADTQRIFNPATQLMQPPRGLEFDFTQPEGEQALICNASRRSCGNPTLRRPRQLRLESHGLGRTTMQLVRAIARLANRVPIPAAPPSKAFLRSVGRQPSFTHADLAKKLEGGSRQGGGCAPSRKLFFLRRKPLRLVDLSS